MLSGQMMNLPLTITSIMEFAERVHGDSEIVSVTADNPAHRYRYADAFRRARQLANALAGARGGAGRPDRDPGLERLPAFRTLLRSLQLWRCLPHDQSPAVSGAAGTTLLTMPVTA